MYTHPLYHWPGKTNWLEKPSASRVWRDFSAYVHFPYCRHLCSFCGYETRLISRNGAQSFARAAERQIGHYAEVDDFSKAALRAVFFGGGTASLMPEKGLATVLSSIMGLGGPTSGREVTLECEPGTIGRQKLRLAKAAGVNRISVCAQAFDDAELARISRRHTHRQSLKLIDDCLAVGIDNLHVDLMYGLPGQTLEQWTRTLESVSNLPVQHVSVYKLYVFRHGMLDRHNAVQRPQEESEAETSYYGTLHDAAQSLLSGSGFRQYTLTEYARPGRKCRYVESCFDGSDLLPIGPSSFGRCGREIWDNSPYVHLFGTPESFRHDRALKLSILETLKRDVILGLWLLNVPLTKLASRLGISIQPKLIELLDTLRQEGKIEFDGETIRLSGKQRFGAGEAMARLGALEAYDWGDVQGTGVAEEALDRNGTRYSGEMATIIRMARRDPELFEALNCDPRGTLSMLDHRLGPDELEDLCNAIGVMSVDWRRKDQTERLGALWQLVRAEHGHPPDNGAVSEA